MQADRLVPDAANAKSFDHYSYVLNNPVKYNDPTGHDAVLVGTLIEAGFMLAGAAVGYGIQVNDNLNKGMDFQQALTTDIKPEPIVNGALIGGAVPIAALAAAMAVQAVVPLSAAACSDGDCTNEVATGKKVFDNAIVNNPVPSRLARVFDADLVGKTKTLSPPGTQSAFVTGADDIAGITDAQALSQRLSLTNIDGGSLEGSFAVLEFNTPECGVASPVFQSTTGYNSEFIGNGLTAGGAREFIIPNMQISDLQDLVIRILE